MPSTSRLDIDLAAVASNLKVVRGVLARGSAGLGRPEPRICAVIKADAYALGAPRIAKRLAMSGVDMFAVYTPDQARALIESAITTPTLILMPVHELDRSDLLYRAASRGQVHFAVHDRATLDAMALAADRLGIALWLHLDLDTGMSRGGADPSEAGVLARRIDAHPRLKLAGVFNHFAGSASDPEFTEAQAHAFTQWLEEHQRLLSPDCMIHEANTFGLLRSAAYHRTMVRVGVALLGYAQEDFADPEHFEFVSEASALTPVLRWTSKVVQIKTIEAGTPVGYASTWRALRPTRVALVPVGYADGYPVALSNRAQVKVDLSRGGSGVAPVIGRVSMDQLTLDVTDLPSDQVTIGTTVELIGPDRQGPTHLPTLARQAGTITHELLLRLNPKIARHYSSLEVPVPAPVMGSIAV